jgi:hypothetical protein
LRNIFPHNFSFENDNKTSRNEALQSHLQRKYYWVPAVYVSELNLNPLPLQSPIDASHPQMLGPCPQQIYPKLKSSKSSDIPAGIAQEGMDDLDCEILGMQELFA